MAKQAKVSKEGFAKLQEELEYLKTVKRVEVGEAIKKARAFGDLSENSEYDEAKNEQAEIESKIAHLEEIIANAVVLDDSDINTDHVSVGCKVSIIDLNTDEKYDYTIVGSTEADPIDGKISDESPLGKALIGLRVGDTITVETPGGNLKINVTEISK